MDRDLMNIGQHCSHPSCRQVDFLPFTCDCCQQVFCLDHRKYADHHCPKAGTKETPVIICPLCAKAIKLDAGQDANAAFELHTKEECDPSHYDKVHKKPRCPIGNCKEKLSTVNTYHCKACNQKVCLKHRHADDHNCATVKAQCVAEATVQRSLASKLQQALQLRPSAQQSRACALKQYEDPLNTVHGTAHRRMDKSSQVPKTNAFTQQAQGQPEVCPQCSARFSSVERLIQHVEEYHLSSASTSTTANGSTGVPVALGSGHSRRTEGTSGADVYQCHGCGQCFHNPVQLVQHSERCSQQQGVGLTTAGRDTCVIS